MSRSGRLTAACLAGATAFGLSLVAGEGVATAAPTYTHTYVVNTWLDPSPASPAGCTSNPEGTCSFRDALTAYAADATGTDLITFAPSTSGHTFFVTTALDVETNNSVPLTITGNGGQNTVLDGSNSTQVLYFQSPASVTMTGVVVQHGNAEGLVPGGAVETGGGSITLTLSNDVITSNTAAEGGGIYVGVGTTLNLSNSSMSSNTAPEGSGGAIVNAGDLNVTSTRFSSNTAEYIGGAIENATLGTVIIDSSVIGGSSTASNYAPLGGGIDNEGPTGSVTLNATNVSYNNYGDPGSQGGGINNYGTLTANGGTVSDNFAVTGGGLLNNGGTVILDASAQVESNVAEDGGGIDNYYPAQLQISQGSTIARNDASAFGGGILNCGTANVTASSVDSNQTQGEGGGIYNSLENTSCAPKESELQGNAEVQVTAGSQSPNTVAAVAVSSNACPTSFADAVTPSLTFASEGTLTMTQSDLSRNFACFGGGGLYSLEASSTISGSTVNNNSVSADNSANQDNSGGGIYSDDDTTLVLSGDTLSGNSAPGGFGGGALLDTVGAVISGGTFTHDSAGDGGAISNGGSLLIDGTGNPVSLVTDSAAVNGGAIYNVNAESLTLQGAFNLARNSAGILGGAIYNQAPMTVNGSSPTLSTIYANSAFDGGGIFNLGLLALNSTGVTYNTASSEGGGVYDGFTFSGSGNVITNNTPNNVFP